MQVKDAIISRRSIRKFKPDPPSYAVLKEFVNLGRLSASAANMQPLKFAILEDAAKQIFPHVKWAGYLPDWDPAPEDAPPAYIAVFGDTTIKNQFETDAGAAIQNILLGAVNSGLAACWLGAIDRPALKALLGFGDQYQLLYLVAIGYPAQESIMFDAADSVKYTMDEHGVVHVPKRPLSEVLLDL